MTELVTSTELVALLGIGEGESARAEIEATLARARELIEVTGARLYTAHLHARHAECLRALGDENAWRRELEEAARLYAEMDATGHAERLAGELAS